MIVVYVLNTIGYSTIIGIFIDTLQALKETESKKQEIIDEANEIMNIEGISNRLKETIRAYFAKTFARKSKQDDT